MFKHEKKLLTSNNMHFCLGNLFIAMMKKQTQKLTGMKELTSEYKFH